MLWKKKINKTREENRRKNDLSLNWDRCKVQMNTGEDIISDNLLFHAASLVQVAYLLRT